MKQLLGAILLAGGGFLLLKKFSTPQEEESSISGGGGVFGGGSQVYDLIVPFTAPASSSSVGSAPASSYSTESTSKKTSVSSPTSYDTLVSQYNAQMKANEDNFLNQVVSTSFPTNSNITKKETTLRGDTIYYSKSGATFTESSSGKIISETPATKKEIKTGFTGGTGTISKAPTSNIVQKITSNIVQIFKTPAIIGSWLSRK